MDILFDALIDSLKILPLIFLMYLIIEFLEHNNNTGINHILMKSKRAGVLYGSVLGSIPQCGFSVIASDLFSKKVITFGTLIAIFVSTSDEAIPIILANPLRAGVVFKIIGIKLIIAIVSGAVIDFIYGRVESTEKCNIKDKHTHFHGNCENCEGGIVKSALIHTVKIFVFIFSVSLVLGIVIDKIGLDRLCTVLMKDTVFQPFIASAVGLIPNCAASVLLTQTYIDGAITFGSLIAGLCSGAGVGLVVLFKRNKNIKENLAALAVLYIIGVAAGIIIQMF